MKPTVFVVDASVDITGAFIAVRREAKLLEGSAEFVLVLPSESLVPDVLLHGFAAVLRLPMPQLRRNVASLAAYLPALLVTSLRLLREMRRRRCECVQINDFYLLHGGLLRILGFKGRIVTWIRIDPARFGRLGKAWLAAAARSSDQLVAVSKFIQSRLPSPIECRVVYDSREPANDGRACPLSTRQLLYVSNYIPGKGHGDAIDAFERVASSYPDAKLCFVGGDMGRPTNRSYREALQARAAGGTAAAQIEFLERTDDLAPLYRGSYAALNFSASESFSLTCQDASAFGLPIVATRSGGPEEIIEDGQSGFLVPVGDIGAMANRMAELLASPRLAARMGERGSEIVRTRFARARVRRELIDVLNLSDVMSD